MLKINSLDMHLITSPVKTKKYFILFLLSLKINPVYLHKCTSKGFVRFYCAAPYFLDLETKKSILRL
jgi:hypothetical protein